MLKLAADKGHPQAQYLLGMKYINGTDVTQDDNTAIEWLEKAASKNHQDAQSYLAWMTMLGQGKPANVSKSIKWFLQARAVQETYPTDVAEVDETDIETAIFQTSRTTEDPLTQFNRGVSLIEAKNGNIQQGMQLIESAAIDNQPQAQIYLAKLYLSGNQIPQNQALGAKWLERCAQSGNLEAQYDLGWLYVNGEGVTRDYHKAYEWFDKASRAGHKSAISAKKFVSNQLAPEPVKQAKKWVWPKLLAKK
jgi:TPR repeat protein